ncbi:hypothetical protein GNZ12_34795 [Paraburkholderia sp. 1N]|uniref:ChrB C-terminal domain-containing protein n=1 Tax=Paraburkholderia solitsugae TaxID=2675748 RepID=A0ABX2C2F2_9BURK|nr:hypothetical protein [Paraburkholderia solitsugae]
MRNRHHEDHQAGLSGAADRLGVGLAVCRRPRSSRCIRIGVHAAASVVRALCRGRRQHKYLDRLEDAFREWWAMMRDGMTRNPASTDAEVAWEDVVALAETVPSPGKPHAAERAIRPLWRDEYQARTGATRQRLWVDRVASAWLIRRFIDPKMRFLWLDSPEACPPDALGFDFDGAAFTQVGVRVTFEVLLVSFGLDDDAALLRLGEMVHALDVGGAPVPEAIGFEAVMAGARQRALDDDQLLDEMGRVLDSIYANFTASTKNSNAAGRS